MRLCLNMIVKNESAILERCLLSVLPHIHSYFICDTGSTDDTVEVIKRVLKGISGEVVLTTFHNFEQARNEALCGAITSTLEFDYLLLIDADMELVAEDHKWPQKLSHPAYTLRQVSGNFSYHNVRLIARDNKARYVGLTHEYLDLEKSAVAHRDVYMLDHACGSSRSEKTERDLALLTTAVDQDPNDARSYFYLAQTLREAGRYDEAIAAYEQRIALGGWEEETWFARFMIARCHEKNDDIPGFLANCLEAYNLRPTRAEPLHALAYHYRRQGKNEACSLLCEMGLEIPRPDDVLFIQEDVYRTAFRQELSICGFYSKLPKRKALARQFCEELAVDRTASSEVRETARSNWMYYAIGANQLFESARLVGSENLPGEKPGPRSLVDVDDPWLDKECPIALDDQRGGGCATTFDGGSLHLTYQVRSKNDKPVHLHRFMFLDKALRVRAITEPFYFSNLAPERCTILTTVTNQDQLLLRFGIDDDKPSSLVVEADDVRQRLRKLEFLS